MIGSGIYKPNLKNQRAEREPMNNPEQARPASLINLAFDTGAIAERTWILGLIRTEMERQLQGMVSFSEAARHKHDVLEKLADQIMEGKNRPKAEHQQSGHAD